MLLGDRECKAPTLFPWGTWTADMETADMESYITICKLDSMEIADSNLLPSGPSRTPYCLGFPKLCVPELTLKPIAPAALTSGWRGSQDQLLCESQGPL